MFGACREDDEDKESKNKKGKNLNDQNTKRCV